MDERHWWVAGKIQESFHIGGYDNPTLLEDFMCEPETLEMINQFLNAGGPCRLFFYSEKPETDTLSTRQLRLTGSLATLKDVVLEDITILYFLRRSVDYDVDTANVEKDVLCGELKGNTMEGLSALLTEIYMPLLKAQKDWGECSQENQQMFMNNMEKFVHTITESAGQSSSSKQLLLRQPDNIVGNDFKQHRLAASDQQVIAEYEQLVSEWISTIEGILTDTTDERFMDPTSGPLSELDKWKRRQRLLTNLTEQLKSKECKTVIGVLITAKSRLLKRWKIIDSGITDAMNETKDKVRYLESMKRNLDQLYNGATPTSIINVALPGIMSAVRQMDSVSKFYSRQGFLGILFTKITNQMVLASKQYLRDFTLNGEEDLLWKRVHSEVHAGDTNSANTISQQLDSVQRAQVQAQLDARLRGSTRLKNKAEATTHEVKNDTLVNRLKACLALQSVYRDTLRTLRDSLGTAQNLSHFTSISSINGPPSLVNKSKPVSSGPGAGRPGLRSKTRGSLSVSDGEGHGVSIADEQTIMALMDNFCIRIRKVIDVINTLTQFSKLVRSTGGLPRPRKEDMVYNEEREVEIDRQEEVQGESPRGEQRDVPGDQASGLRVTVPARPEKNLGVITEDEEESTEQQQQEAETTAAEAGDAAAIEESHNTKQAQEEDAFDFYNSQTGLTKKDVDLLKKYFPDNKRSVSASVMSVVDQHVEDMVNAFTESVNTKALLDAEGKEKDKFDESYTQFQSIVQQLEAFICAYLHAIFARKMKTQEGLQLMNKFVAVQQRSGVRVIIAEKFVEIFTWYEGDLDGIQQLYEKHKDSPPSLRNAPPVAGAIYWSRQLLKRIEQPMTVFRENKAITALKDFSRVVRIYNRLATALVTFEGLWFNHWKAHIEGAKNGLKATLFITHPETGEILVNADERVLELIQEAKWLSRLNIELPESVISVINQENRFKNYKDHLELCVGEFNEVVESIPPAMHNLFEAHIEKAAQNFHPGLTTLSWNSMNIDAFLNQIHRGTAQLQSLVNQVNRVTEAQVEETLNKIQDMVFFDYKRAFVQSWPPEEFMEIMNESIELSAQELYGHISNIESALRDSASILMGKKIKGENTMTSRSQKSDDYTKSKSEERRQSLLSKGEGTRITELLGKYSDRIYEAVLVATTRSLVTLAESSGCEGDAVRAASALSEVNLCRSTPRPRSTQSRITSAASERPISVLSMLSSMSWTTEKTSQPTYLQFKVGVSFDIPTTVIEPTLNSIQAAINMVARNILNVPKGVQWNGSEELGETFQEMVQEDDVVNEIMAQVTSVVSDLEPAVKQHLRHFSMYDFLWKDDMQGNYTEFIQHDPGSAAIQREVERLLKIEKKVLGIPDELPVGPVILVTTPIKNALHGFAIAWKTQYASVLHEEAKKKLDAAVLYRSNVRQRLELHVSNLDQLNNTLHLLEELRDMEIKIDEIYLPIETMYNNLRTFELRLPRPEVEEVGQLREKWKELLELSEEARDNLLKERRVAFEQELDKQVKTFVVEVIQFRNAFDAQGPAVPGIVPSEAVDRLQDFQQRYSLYDIKRKTLDSVSKLFGIVSKQYPELSKTGEELALLGMLYGLFQKFIRFDEVFRDTLWADVDLESSHREVESYWDECLALPSKLKDWDAYTEMKAQIQQYLDVFPLLHKLASKEIRNRHWLQVMSVTGSSFQLEANVFRLFHLLDIGLIKHRSAIEEICKSASRELELEVKLRMTEEEWTEQVLNFEPYKRRGPMYLDKAYTERLLEQLEDAQALLAQMLTSRYIGPLREEAASWAEKLKDVGEVLEQWLEVQDLWQYLEAVFSNPEAARELPQEAKRFERIDKGWTKMMKRAFDAKNVLQCCYGGDVPKGVVLRHIYEELEICFKSLMGYLDNKRRAFPRFYFVSDPVLLALLSRPNDLESVRPHLRTIFGAVHDVELEKQSLSDSEFDLRSTSGDVIDREGARKSTIKMGGRAGSSPMGGGVGGSVGGAVTPGAKIDKRLAQIQERTYSPFGPGGYMNGTESSELNVNPHVQGYVSTMLPSEGLAGELVTYEAVGVTSLEGEHFRLDEKVTLQEGVEVWLNKLRDSVSSTIHDMLLQAIKDINNGAPVEDWPIKYPTQICRMGLLYLWTRDCEQGVSELKYERKSMGNTVKKFSAALSKLPTVLTRCAWKNSDEAFQPVHRIRIENMITMGLFLKDMIEVIANRKIRETTDFEWRRNLRFYVHDNNNDKPEPTLMMLDQQYTYGSEFYGAHPAVAPTPQTDKCFLSMSQAMAMNRGSLVVGGQGAGKTETIKGFAQQLGRFLAVFQCTKHSDPQALGRLLHGMAMDGCWGCMDDLHELGREAMSTLLDYAQAILNALKAKSNYCTLGDGSEISIQSTCAMFMTYDPHVLPTFELPQDIRANFRQVSLARPDFNLVLKAKCSALGLKAPSILALRLRLVTQLTNDQLAHGSHNHIFSVAAITGVLQSASQRKRFIKEEKPDWGRSNTPETRRSIQQFQGQTSLPEGQQEMSRSNSQMSITTSHVPQQTSTAVAGKDTRGKPMLGGAPKKPHTPNPISAAAKLEHAIVGQMLLDIIGPRLNQQDGQIFKQIVRDVFHGLPDPPLERATTASAHAHRRSLDLEIALKSTAQENGLVPHKPFIEKCMQLYSIAGVHQGICIAGPPGSGKSSVVQTLVDALCVTPRGSAGIRPLTHGARPHHPAGSTRFSAAGPRGGSSVSAPTTADPAETNYKLQKIYPLIVDDLSLVFGQMTRDHWVDGIFTSAWRKATRNQSTTWLCLDGPLNPSWIDNFSSVLDVNKVLNLANGDKLHLTNNVKILFETGDLSSASPAVVAKTGLVYVDKNVVGWRPLAKAWLENRTQQEVHSTSEFVLPVQYAVVLQRAFDKTLDPVVQFVMNDCKPKLYQSEVGMFQMCIKLLTAMLVENVEIGGELHIERLYLFCLMWSFGGLLDDKDVKGFNEILSTLSTALPDDDRDVCFFDYYVDESGEWDPWHSRVPEALYPSDNHNLLGEIFIDTVDTIRVRLLMEFACASGQNVLLVGPAGSGKTSMINDFFDHQDPQAQVTKKLVFSGSSKAVQLQQFIEANIYHRQGFVYGAKESKKLQMFLDDVNLPVPDGDGVQRVNELLRRLVDDKGLNTLTSPFELRTVQGMCVFACMSMSEHPSMQYRGLDPRLLRHFATINLPGPEGEGLRSIVQGVLEASMLYDNHPGLEIDVHNALVQASCKLLSAVKQVLRPTSMPGRRHYIFTLRDVVTCFQCLKRLADESRADEKLVVSLWKHEMQRVMRDRMCRHSDLCWFDETLDHTVKEIWPELADSLHQHFVTFPTDARVYQRPVTSMSKKETRVLLQPVDKLNDVHDCLQTQLNRYNEEFGNLHLDIMLSENIIALVVRMHRILSLHHSGNILMIGPVGSHLGTLARLALHISDIPIHTMDTSKQNTFLDGLRSAVRLAGAEGKTLTLFFTARDLEDPMYLDAINSLLVSGEYPHLFTNDELDGLLMALQPALKREHPSLLMDLGKYFISRVKTNLHIIMCLPPTHPLHMQAASEYPGLVCGCQVVWMCDWPKENLLEEASYYVNKHKLGSDCETDVSDKMIACLSNIHSYVLEECRQNKWAGDTNEEVQLTQVKIIDKKKDQLKSSVVTLPNRPHAKSIMLEKIKLRHRSKDVPSTTELFVGPLTYRRFMDTFRQIYTSKTRERTEMVDKLKKVIATLDSTRKEAKTMRENIKGTHSRYEAARDKTENLLKDLTARATVLEKLKARVGIATSLGAFLQLNEISDEEEEEDDLLKEEDRDEYDDEFDRKREANLKTRQVQAKEEYETAVKTVETCRKNLAYAKEQVGLWKGKVDRQCIERMKNFQNPPLLVGQVMEMVMTLIGKRLPGQRMDARQDTSTSNYPRTEGESGRFSSSSSGTKLTMKKSHQPDSESRSEESSTLSSKGTSQSPGRSRTGHFTLGGKKDTIDGRFDRGSWKVMQVTMNDTAKFVDMLHNVPWEDGLPEEVVQAVESYLSRSNGQLGVTGEGTLLENAEETQFKAIRRSPSPDNSKGITIAAAKYSSEDAATLVQYTIAIVEYTRLCGPLKASLERVQELLREIEENERLQREKENQAENGETQPDESESAATEAGDEDLNEDDLPRVQSEVNELQALFDASVVDKHSLSIELDSMRERLKTATDIIDSLRPQEQQWRGYVKEHSSNDMLVANCVSAAAFLVYCGALNTDTRKRLGEFFMLSAEEHGLPLPAKQLFRQTELVEFLYSKRPGAYCGQIQTVMREMEEKRLPRTPLMLENAAFVMQGDNIQAWPLLCDPTARVTSWVEALLGDKGLITVKYTDLKSQFDTCLSEGLPLLVTYVDVEQLLKDKRFTAVLQSRSIFTPGRNPFKIQIGDHEVECQPHFRLYLHTTALPHELTAELSAHMSVVYFHQTRGDVEEELLDRFMATEKARLDEERIGLLQERIVLMKSLSTLEQQMINCLSSDVRLLNDLPTTKKLAELKKQYDESTEGQNRVDSVDEGISRAREGFRSISRRGAVCYECALYLKQLDPIYQMSFNQFMDFYNAAIAHSDRASVKAVIDRMTHAVYVSTVRSIKDRDKTVYGLLLALEVSDSLGHVGVGEREFLISPALGSVTMTAAGISQSADSKFVTAKKSFDWMTEEQFSNLQILAIHYEWFQDMFDRMPRDGRETQWRTLCESDQPENQPLPDKMDDHFNSVQRLLIVRAVRGDRLMQAATAFITQVLGRRFVGMPVTDKKRYSNETSLDQQLLLKQTTPTTPVLCLCNKEKGAAETVMETLAKRRQQEYRAVRLSGSGPGEERGVRRALQEAANEGSFLFIYNGHNNLTLISSLIDGLVDMEGVDPNFRLGVTCECTEDLPTSVLHSSIKIMVDSPRTIKDTLVRCFNQYSLQDPEFLRRSSRPEWTAFLHNLAYLAGAVQLKARFGRGGWNKPQDFSNIKFTELFEVLNFALEEFNDKLLMTLPDGTTQPRSPSWTGIRYMLSEVIFGNYVTDPIDQQSLNAMVDYWISTNATKKEFEMPKLKFKLPSSLFSQNIKFNNVLQSIENLSNHYLETPEACNIHPSAETLLGEDQYVFTRLNRIYDNMPASQSLSHALFPRAPTPLEGPPVVGVSGTANAHQVAHHGVFASSALATLRMRKEVELWELCHSLIPKVPKAYNKEYISERMKKIGGNTSFNIFIAKELDMMFKLITEIKTTLQAIKSACEVGVLGDTLTDSMLGSADDLYHMRLPELWREMAGDTAPPPNYNVHSWMADLTSRCQHFERILVHGREKMPAYWLGAFFHPRGLLSLLKQDCYRQHCHDRSGNIDQFVFQTEITSRDKDHIRDPPAEGMFIFGLYLWGCAWEKTAGELQDTPPKHQCATLPVIHLTCWPVGDKPVLQDPLKVGEVYSCPVYQSRIAPRESILELDLQHSGIPAQRWALRGLSATIRPY